MATTRAVLREARTMGRRISQRLRTASGVAASTLARARQQLQQMEPLVTRILDQARARLLGGDIHVPDKVLSVFEPHTEAIRKGKIAKPTELHRRCFAQATPYSRSIIARHRGSTIPRRSMTSSAPPATSDTTRCGSTLMADAWVASVDRRVRISLGLRPCSRPPASPTMRIR